jgi:hypothetical protein
LAAGGPCARAMAGPPLHCYASASCKPPRDRGALARSDEDAPSFPLVGKSGDRTMAADVRPLTARLTHPAHPPTLVPALCRRRPP